MRLYPATYTCTSSLQCICQTALHDLRMWYWFFCYGILWLGVWGFGSVQCTSSNLQKPAKTCTCGGLGVMPQWAYSVVIRVSVWGYWCSCVCEWCRACLQGFSNLCTVVERCCYCVCIEQAISWIALQAPWIVRAFVHLGLQEHSLCVKCFRLSKYLGLNFVLCKQNHVVLASATVVR